MQICEVREEGEGEEEEEEGEREREKGGREGGMGC